MIKVCTMDDLNKCVDIAFERNRRPENNCAFCPKAKESIRRDFELIMNNPDSLMAGHFTDGALTGIFGCFLNPDNHWADCIGPFFQNEWNHGVAREMFRFAQLTLDKAVRFNFYFNARNENCRRLMEALSFERRDNEYILLLNRDDYKPQEIKHRVVNDVKDYEAELIKLHDDTFPDVYVTGKDIVAAMGKTREVFCVLDEDGAFAGYGVLKYSEDIRHLTAEIFAVKSEKRGKGYGWALLNAVVDSAFNKHSGSVVDLVVDKLNAHARDLYYACGFKLAVENESYCLRV